MTNTMFVAMLIVVVIVIGALAMIPALALRPIGEFFKYYHKNVWEPYSTSETRALRVNMANIRRKIEINPAEPKYILTEMGVGYRMVEELWPQDDK